MKHELEPARFLGELNKWLGGGYCSFCKSSAEEKGRLVVGPKLGGIALTSGEELEFRPTICPDCAVIARHLSEEVDLPQMPNEASNIISFPPKR